MSGALNITAATVDPALLDLPWELPLENWPNEAIASLPKGISRHLVRFANLSGYVIAVKETTAEMAKGEYDWRSSPTAPTGRAGNSRACSSPGT
jgi:hypothetical protein